ncbi:unnamed protein product [Pieris macdunnoughi]|uniref:Uncharacterized protein n=1 Tax=Pieris macdunnoughi TaxID=345717 RepID=A0A821RRL5_9NEOP|nr:unnamed protein product [Pieris macdunnoughi]
MATYSKDLCIYRSIPKQRLEKLDKRFPKVTQRPRISTYYGPDIVGMQGDLILRARRTAEIETMKPTKRDDQKMWTELKCKALNSARSRVKTRATK